MMAIRPHNWRPRGRKPIHLWLMLAAVVLLGALLVVGHVLKSPEIARGLGGMALCLFGLGAALKSWSDGRAGVIRGRGGRIEFREADLPNTFAATVAFHVLVGLVIALVGLWILFTTGRAG